MMITKKTLLKAGVVGAGLAFVGVACYRFGRDIVNSLRGENACDDCECAGCCDCTESDDCEMVGKHGCVCEDPTCPYSDYEGEDVDCECFADSDDKAFDECGTLDDGDAE